MRTTAGRDRARTVRARASAVLATLGVLIVSAGMVVMTAPAASAHTGTLEVSSTCQSDGTYLLTFAGHTQNVPSTGNGHVATLRVGEIRPAGAQVTGAPSTVVGNTPYSWTMVVPGGTTYAQSTAFLEWGDGATSDPIGKINLAGTCKAADKPTSVGASFSDPSCDNQNQASYSLSYDADKATYTVSGAKAPGQSVTITFAAKTGYVINGQKVFLHTFGDAEDCRDTVPVPAAPEVSPPTCQSNGSYTLPLDTDKVDWSITPSYSGPGDYTVSADTKDGYKFSDDGTHESWTVNVGVKLRGGECREDVGPVAPTVTSAHCTGPGTQSEPLVGVPADTSTVAYSYDPESNVVTATVTDGDHRLANTLPEGWSRVSDTVATYQVSFVSPGDCLVDASVETAPSATDPTCSEPGHLVLPTDEAFQWTGDTTDTPGLHALTAVANVGYHLVGTTTFTVQVPTRGEALDCRGTVTPTAPTVHDAVCTGPGQQSEPTVDPGTTPGITYSYDEETHTVTATVDEGHKLPAELPEGWVRASEQPLEQPAEQVTSNDRVATYLVTFDDPGECLVAATPLYPSVVPPTCTTAGSLDVPVQPEGVEVTRTGDVPGDVTFTYAPKAGYTLAEGVETTKTVTVLARKPSQECSEVEGTDATRPKPGGQPAVLGTEAAVPTSVDAGLAGNTPADGSSSRRMLLAELLVGGGLVLLAGAAHVGIARRLRRADRI